MRFGFKKRPIIIGTVVVLVVIGAVFAINGNRWVGAKIEKTFLEGLAKRGLDAEWTDSSWDPWRGVHMKGLKIREAAGDRRSVVETDNVDVDFPLLQFLTPGDRKANWRIIDSKVVLTDEAGPVMIENVSARIQSIGGMITVKNFKGRNAGLTADLKGTIELNKPGTRPPKPFVLKLSAVRGSLAALDFGKDAGTFHVTGNFAVDARNAPDISWNAKLNGAGEEVVWKQIPFNTAEAEAELSSGDSVIKAAVKSPSAAVGATMRRTGWKQTPFLFEGTLKDTAGRENTFAGSYEAKTFIIDEMKGAADLWAVSSDIPMASDKRPDNIEVSDFPQIDAQDIRWNREEGFQIGAAKIGPGGTLWITFDDDRIETTDLTGTVSYRDGATVLKNAKAKVFGGTISADGTYQNGEIRNSTVKADRIKLAEIKRIADADGTAGKSGILTVNYKGDIHFKSRRLEGGGSIRLDDAPVFDVPLLEQVDDLFAALIPGAERCKEGRFEADFASGSHLVKVTRFEATGGSLNVSAVGTVDLRKERVDGRARGKLTGLPGVVTSPLSRLLEMDVGGPFDDLRVKPMGPAKLVSNAASGTVGTAVDVIEEAGSVTGTMLKEGVKVPFRFMKKKIEEQKADKK